MDDQNTIKANQSRMNVLLTSKVDNIQSPCLSLKSGFFLYFIGLRILLSRTNMVLKIYGDLSALGSRRMFCSNGSDTMHVVCTDLVCVVCIGLLSTEFLTVNTGLDRTMFRKPPVSAEYS